jgi:hypothetical protein
MMRRFCTRCHRWLDLKDRRIRKVDTVFGTVPFRSARIVSCPCETPFLFESPYSPMTEYVPERAPGELLALEAKLSAQMPYRQVVVTIREFLPVRSTLNHVTVRNRALRAGMCKRQQMRWSPPGVHLLAQVRCAFINGDLVERLARYEKPKVPLSSEATELINLLERASEQIPLRF